MPHCILCLSTLLPISFFQKHFYNRKCTKPNEILPFGKQHTFFAFDQIGEDLIFGTTSFPKEMTPLYPRERCQLKRRNQTHEWNKV